jgi:hypothetical protein
MGEVRNFPVKPSTEEELAAAKEATVRSLPGRFETNGIRGTGDRQHLPLQTGRWTTTPICLQNTRP